MKISIIIPVFNEQQTIFEIIGRIKALDLSPWKKEIIVVDDCSTDGTQAYLSIQSKKNDIILVEHKKNLGKGAAIRSGIKYVSGDYVVIQDADLEYNPNDIKKLIDVVEKKGAPVVYGSRFIEKRQKAVFLHREANIFLTHLTNIIYQSNLTDMETCYKLIQTRILKSIPLSALRFEFEPEVTAKLLKKRIPIIEIPISYTKRGYSEGKKITAKDFFEAIWTLFILRFSP